MGAASKRHKGGSLTRNGSVASRARRAESHPITFTLPKRKQTRRQGLRLLKGSVSEHELTTIAGIPTTTPAKTVLDLLDDTEDPSLVANVLRDAARTDEKVLGDEFVAKVDSRGKRYGIPRGESLYSRLMEG